jgi:segregation and condensation protein A
MSPTDAPERLALSLEGFEGPLDLLLDLARAQKIDLARISILALVEQYLAIIEGARLIRLELAADWLVMAAWLAWLKSRLLLPPEDEAAQEGEDAAAVLAARLAELEVMRAAAAWLGARAQLGYEIFPRGSPENRIVADRSRLVADLPSLLRAYVEGQRRAASLITYQPRQLSFWTVQDALSRLEAIMGTLPEWSTLEAFLPAHLAGDARRAALASTLIASLELARGGGIRLRQDQPFAPILLGRSDAVP